MSLSRPNKRKNCCGCIFFHFLFGWLVVENLYPLLILQKKSLGLPTIFLDICCSFNLWNGGCWSTFFGVFFCGRVAKKIFFLLFLIFHYSPICKMFLEDCISNMFWNAISLCVFYVSYIYIYIPFYK